MRKKLFISSVSIYNLYSVEFCHDFEVFLPIITVDTPLGKVK